MNSDDFTVEARRTLAFRKGSKGHIDSIRAHQPALNETDIINDAIAFRASFAELDLAEARRAAQLWKMVKARHAAGMGMYFQEVPKEEETRPHRVVLLDLELLRKAAKDDEELAPGLDKIYAKA